MKVRGKIKNQSRLIDYNLKLVKRFCNKNEYFNVSLEINGKVKSRDFIKSEYIKRMRMVRKVINRDIREKYKS